MFLGEHYHSLDAKGRLIFPSRYREPLGSPVVLQKGIDRCLYVYPQAEWERVVSSVRSLPTTDPNARRYARFFFSQAWLEELDRQGRLTIPASFRDYAGLQREVAVVGAGARVEVWDRQAWDSHRAEAESRVEDISAQLGI